MPHWMAGMKIFVQIITEEENERILRAVNFLSDTDTAGAIAGGPGVLYCNHPSQNGWFVF